MNPVYNALNDSTLYCVRWYKVLCTTVRSVLNGGYVLIFSGLCAVVLVYLNG